MQKPHPHPTLDISCKDCKFWHPAYIDVFMLNPATGQASPAKQLLASGQSTIGLIKQRASMCFRNPVWTLEGEDMYCGNFESNPRP